MELADYALPTILSFTQAVTDAVEDSHPGTSMFARDHAVNLLLAHANIPALLEQYVLGGIVRVQKSQAWTSTAYIIRVEPIQPSPSTPTKKTQNK